MARAAKITGWAIGTLVLTIVIAAGAIYLFRHIRMGS